ncbi:MAG: diacylglycerol kinase family protein [Vicinamibacterales bacterium]
MADRVCVIVNPAAGRGRGAKALTEVTAAFGAVGISDIRTTRGREDEGDIARRVMDAGATTLVAVGGDGTWGNVANAILTAGAGRQVRLALIAAGTGNDFAKTAGCPATDIPATASLVSQGTETIVDVGRIEEHFFLNITGFGFDVAVLEDILKLKWVKGEALYLFSALRQLSSFKGVEIDIASPAKRRGGARHLMLVIANAKNFGGKFKIAPGASLTDGLLDAVAILDASTVRRVKLFGAVAKGTHQELNEVIIEQSPSFTVRFSGPPAYETDGEYRQAKTAVLEVACVPGALRLVAPAPSQAPQGR